MARGIRFFIVTVSLIGLCTGAVLAEDQPCPVTTFSEAAGALQAFLLKTFPDAQISLESDRLRFTSDVRGTTAYRYTRESAADAVEEIPLSEAGITGEFFETSLDKATPFVEDKTSQGRDDFFKTWELTVPSRAVGKAFVLQLTFAPQTSQAFLDDLMILVQRFGSCRGSAATPNFVDEAIAARLAEIYIRRDATASEVLKGYPEALRKVVSGDWKSKHEILFRCGCCCACDGECTDLAVRMTGEGRLADIKVKRWSCEAPQSSVQRKEK